ncbi:helix-turn-helix transcriptional regulator [Listeria innocua]|uniref:helix-turn-helix domain-containing protein n=1 Tax=Listeria monocytogenes TaxID=1639 RepID=UPI000874859A|nr:helix-turn-helix transcriptional regulator [Listeria monocytogenes]EHF3647092.1 helix-turn-helix transcriptional regulator [Listeria innocua]EAE1801302.1 XRE family transcriptional regulator [Listeria monocytogenes]EAE7321117.1 XRE family transcriptional regulator [Listeria monocytogenes]EAF1403362.1 XRE family transcriptional regulator [Listeria monocytogenes]EBF5135085.1 helix-turn-helix transcriptional regulator [Listeria monocytogenes]
MVKKFGSELKNIRKTLGISQRALSDDGKIISKSSLQRIESDNQTPSVDIANSLLQRLDISSPEMEYRLNNFSLSEKEKLINEFREIGSSANVTGINSLLIKMKTFLQSDYSAYISNLILILESLTIFQKEQSFENARKIVAPIWQSLEKRDEWLYKDILLISNIIYMFDGETFLNMKNRLLFFINKYYHLGTVKKLYIITLLNSVLYMKKNNRFIEAEEDLNIALIKAKEQNEHIRYLDALSLKAELLWLKGEKETSIKIARESFIKLYCLEQIDILEDNMKDWEKLTNIKVDTFLKPFTELF